MLSELPGLLVFRMESYGYTDVALMQPFRSLVQPGSTYSQATTTARYEGDYEALERLMQHFNTLRAAKSLELYAELDYRTLGLDGSRVTMSPSKLLAF